MNMFVLMFTNKNQRNLHSRQLSTAPIKVLNNATGMQYRSLRLFALEK